MPWSRNELVACFAYLDATSLVQSSRVAKEWYAAAQGPALWTAQYCAAWRNGAPLPEALARAFSRAEMTRICAERLAIPLAVSTLAVSFAHAERSVFLSNIALFRPKVYVVAVRSSHALRPLGLSRAPGDAGSEMESGVCYFEVMLRGIGSIGVALFDELPSTDPDSDDKRATAHVGRMAGSYGYHGADGRFYWCDEDTPRDADYGPRWGYRIMDPETMARDESTPEEERVVSTLGCGLDVRSGRLFFTKNGEWLGDAPVRVAPSASGYSAAFAFENYADTAFLNVGREPFVFDIEAHVAVRKVAPTTTAP